MLGEFVNVHICISKVSVLLAARGTLCQVLQDSAAVFVELLWGAVWEGFPSKP